MRSIQPKTFSLEKKCLIYINIYLKVYHCHTISGGKSNKLFYSLPWSLHSAYFNFFFLTKTNQFAQLGLIYVMLIIQLKHPKIILQIFFLYKIIKKNQNRRFINFNAQTLNLMLDKIKAETAS